MSTLQHLYAASVKGTITDAEHQELLDLLAATENREEALQLIRDGLNATYDAGDGIAIQRLGVIQHTILKADPRSATEKVAATGHSQSPAHRIHFLKTAWFRYAAAIFLIAGAAAYLYTASQVSGDHTKVAGTHTKPKQPDILPGGNKAILTLANGSVIVLDSAANGQLAKQGDTKILKLDAGSLAYRPGVSGGVVGYNTISTPKGGQYQITLTDGSKIWLNAASSVKFPTAFNGKDRNISVTGEVYCEIASDKNRPFSVDANGATIQVLGTSFNINAYMDEPALKATLIEGKVKVMKGSTYQLLQPGQQAMVNDAVELNSHPNLQQAVAWRNGIFDFQNATLEAVMRQLARWYNIEVKYAKGVPAVKFYGEMGRDLNLSDILEFLQKTKIHFRLEGNQLTVLP